MLDIQPSNNWRYQSRADIKPSAGLKVCLFGQPEPEKLDTDFKQLLGEIQQAERLRWDYDFKSDQPLPGGRYQWKKMSASKLDLGTAGESEKRSSDHLDSSGETESDVSIADSPEISSSSWSKTLSGSVAFSPSTQRSLSGWYMSVFLSYI